MVGPDPLPAPGPFDIHLWHHDHHTSIGPERMSALLALVSPDEHARFTHMRNDGRRQQFLIGRALSRHVLSRYAPVQPGDWRFALGPRGKPSIASPVLSSPLWFNLSHTDGVSVCAVTGAGPEIGIDIELIAPAPDSLEIAEQFFPDAETTALRRRPQEQRREIFVRLWALKESFAKAREANLGDVIRGTTFDLARPDKISVTFDEPLHENVREWQFRLFQLDPAQIIALAVRTDYDGALSLRTGACPEL